MCCAALCCAVLGYANDLPSYLVVRNMFWLELYFILSVRGTPHRPHVGSPSPFPLLLLLLLLIVSIKIIALIIIILLSIIILRDSASCSGSYHHACQQRPFFLFCDFLQLSVLLLVARCWWHACGARVGIC